MIKYCTRVERVENSVFSLSIKSAVLNSLTNSISIRDENTKEILIAFHYFFRLMFESSPSSVNTPNNMFAQCYSLPGYTYTLSVFMHVIAS